MKVNTAGDTEYKENKAFLIAQFRRDVIYLHDSAGMTFREIAEYLGFAPSWIYKNYKRGKEENLV